jgi:hypothetical protein
LKDGLNPQCFAATIFIYFASLSGAIAFGGLMGTKTRDDIGIPETLLGKISTKSVLFFYLMSILCILMMTSTSAFFNTSISILRQNVA